MAGCGSGSENNPDTNPTSSQALDSNRIAIASQDTAISLTAIPVSSAMIALAWTGDPEENENTPFKIFRDGMPIATVIGTTNYDDMGLAASSPHVYWIEALNSSGTSDQRSNEVQATTPQGDSTAPLLSSSSLEDGEPHAVNSAINMDFSAPMTVATLNSETVSVETRTGKRIPGKVTVSGNTATFTSTETLSADTGHTVSVSPMATDVAGNRLAEGVALTFATAAVADTTPPKVSTLFPAYAATAIGTNTSVMVTFSEAMTNSTITTSTFRMVSVTGLAVSGTIRFAGTTAIFTPAAPLAASTRYTATLTTGVRDAAGNALPYSYAWHFTTGTAADLAAPRVVTSSPMSGASGVPVNAGVSATLSEMMKSSTITSATFRLANAANGSAVSGTVSNSISSKSAFFRPLMALNAATRYTATITTGAQDAAGNPLTAAYSWTFTTAGTLDTVAPRVASTVPANQSGGIGTSASISATFTEPIRDTTLTTTTFNLKRTSDGAVVNGVVSVSGNTATFDPAATLGGNTSYTATITTGVRDTAGNALPANYSWTFITVAPSTTAALSWNAVSVSGLSGYRVYFGTAPGAYQQAKGQGVNAGIGTTYTVSGLTRGRRYYFAVTAFSSGAESAYSNEVYKDIP